MILIFYINNYYDKIYIYTIINYRIKNKNIY